MQLLRAAVISFVLGIGASHYLMADSITYQVTVDTTAISGTAGFLDFDFAPGNGSQAAFVSIGSLSPSPPATALRQVNGGVSGDLPGTLTIDNSTQFNDYFVGLGYETALTFLLTFDGPALTSPDGIASSGSTFAFGMFDSTGNIPLLTTDPNGNTFTVDVNLDGTTTVTTFPSDGNGGAAAASLVVVATVPEPSALELFAFGLAGLAVWRDRHRRGTWIMGAGILLPLAVSAWAESPAISFTPPKSDLGAQLVGTRSQAALETIHNQTTASLLVSGIGVEGDDAADFSVSATNAFPATLAPGANLEVQIAFTPRAPWRRGTRDARLKVTTGQGIYLLALTGMGVTCGGPVWAASSNGACADTDGDGFNDEWEERGYIDLNNNGREDDEDFRFPVRRLHVFSAVKQFGVGQGQVFPTVSNPSLPAEAASITVMVVTGGPLGAATFTYAVNGHVASGARPIRPVADLAGNFRLMFYGGIFNAGDLYTFQVSMGPELKIADKNVPNIYVDYDFMDWDTPGNACMVDSDCDAGGNQLNSVCHRGSCNHSHFPGDPLFRKVVDQFAKHGITLYIDPTHRAVPHAQVITWSRPGDGTSGATAACAGANVVAGNIGPGQFAVSFDDVKYRPGSDFTREPLRKDIYHYTVLSHAHTCLTDQIGVPGSCKSCPADRSTPAGFPFATSTGTAELPGNDFIVALGSVLNDGGQPTNPFLEGGVFMHELGHNLGLHHAGDVAVPEKAPNYLSVMNYRYTLAGITHAAAPGSNSAVENLRELNYSEHELVTLNEAGLFEQAGVSPLSSGYTGIVRFFNAVGGNAAGPEAGPVDWSGNGFIDTGTVSVDLNLLNGTTETMRGYADWVHGACTVPPVCRINAVRVNIHDNIDPSIVDASIDIHEPCVQKRCQSLWLPFQFTPWGKKD
jgi:hypothetical protein